MSAVEDTLSWEAEQRPRVAPLAIAAGLLTFAGAILFALLTNNTPTEDSGFISLTESLGATIGGGDPQGPSLLVRQVDFYGDNLPALVLAAVLTAAGALLTGLVLLFLFRAIFARSETVGRLPLFATVTGLVMFPIGHLVRQIGAWTASAGFEDAEVRTAETAREIFAGSAVVAGQLFEVLGSFALALAFVLVAMNAMRVGLLTRFLGILGIIVGALAVFQLDQPQIIRTFWLVAVGVLLSGRLRAGLPPAWLTGQAEPWPSRQQVLEAKQAAAGGGGGGGGRSRGTATVVAPASEGDDTATPGQQRKKRKKRR